jgi:hypothetical protein
MKSALANLRLIVDLAQAANQDIAIERLAILELADMITRLQKDQITQEAALTFYADPENWKEVESGIGIYPGDAVDYGNRARIALGYPEA